MQSPTSSVHPKSKETGRKTAKASKDGIPNTN